METWRAKSHVGKYKKISYLRWKPTVSFKEGVKSMMKNIQYWSNAPLWTKKKLIKQPKFGLIH